MAAYTSPPDAANVHDRSTRPLLPIHDRDRVPLPNSTSISSFVSSSEVPMETILPGSLSENRVGLCS